MVDVEVSETGCLLQEDFSLENCQPEVEIRKLKITTAGIALEVDTASDSHRRDDTV